MAVQSWVGKTRKQPDQIRTLCERRKTRNLHWSELYSYVLTLVVFPGFPTHDWTAMTPPSGGRLIPNPQAMLRYWCIYFLIPFFRKYRPKTGRLYFLPAN